MRTLSAFLDWLADHKGTPVLVGIGLILLNFLIVLLAPGGWVARTNLFLHAGLIIGLLGELVAAIL